MSLQNKQPDRLLVLVKPAAKQWKKIKQGHKCDYRLIGMYKSSFTARFRDRNTATELAAAMLLDVPA